LADGRPPHGAREPPRSTDEPRLRDPLNGARHGWRVSSGPTVTSSPRTARAWAAIHAGLRTVVSTRSSSTRPLKYDLVLSSSHPMVTRFDGVSAKDCALHVPGR